MQKEKYKNSLLFLNTKVHPIYKCTRVHQSQCTRVGTTECSGVNHKASGLWPYHGQPQKGKKNAKNKQKANYESILFTKNNATMTIKEKEKN